MKFKFFKSKQQEEIVKAIEPPDITKSVSQNLKLARLKIEYSASMRNPYTALIEYKERPEDWNNHGVTDEMEIIGESWSDLLDKVSEHFGEINE